MREVRPEQIDIPFLIGRDVIADHQTAMAFDY
jgi:hypothetical protein